MSLQGATQLRARFRAIKTVFKPLAREWQDATVPLARAAVPVRTGKTRQSIRRGRTSNRRATVVGSYVTNFIDAGSKAHTEVPKRARVLRFESHGQAMFAKKVNKPAIPARPFKKRAAAEGFRKVDGLGELVKLWNGAA